MTVDHDRAARLRAAREAKGFASASAAAQRLNVKLSTYTHHENGTRNFSVDYAKLYARAFGVSFDHLYFGVRSIGPVGKVHTSGIAVVGDVCAGIWRESAVISSQAGTMVDAPAADTARVAYRVSDTSADLSFQPGDVAIVAPDEKAFQDGDLVVVMRRRTDLVETSIRRVSDNGTRLALHSKTRNPKDDITYPAPAKSQETVAIVGKVVGRYSPL